MVQIRYSELSPINRYNHKYRAELYIDNNQVCSVEAMTLVEAFGSILINYSSQIGVSLQEVIKMELV